MSTHYQIAVIGSGPGGYIAALEAAHHGARTAIVEAHPFFGGTCLNWGCIPSKALLATAELAHRISHAAEMGLQAGPARVDWPAIQKRKDGILRRLRGGIGSLFQGRGVDTYNGRGALDGRGRVLVHGQGTTDTITADSVLLATGSSPIRLPGWPDDPERIATSDEALHWKDLPRRLLIVGGGVIACEFACMLQPLGVDVVIVEMQPSLLPLMDEDLGTALEDVFRKRGIAVHTGTSVADVQVRDERVSVRLDDGTALEVDRVLVAVGRRPNTDSLGLETAGVRTGERGFLDVGDDLRTSAAGVFAVGDANGRCQLAHAASHQGVVAVANALGGNQRDNQPIPWCVYTFPEVAGVGLTEAECRTRRLPVAVGRFPFAHLGKAMGAGETFGFVKVLRHRETDAILGVHMIGHHATELIHSATAMMASRATARDLGDLVFAHPTMGEAIKEAAGDSYYAALHLPPREVHRVTAEFSH